MFIKSKLQDEIKCAKEKIKIFFLNHSKIQNILNILIVVFFSFLFFSIPAFSFRRKLFVITWILSFIVVVFMTATFILFNPIKIDVIILSYIIFCVSAMISCSFSKFVTFNYTYFLLTAFLIIIYSYCRSNKYMIKLLFFSAYFANIAFLLYFIAVYGRDVFLLGSIRLGDYFGDINDIAIFNGLGLTFSTYYCFFSKKNITKIINIVLFILFCLVIISSGSKITYIFIPSIFFFCIFLKNGKKRLWLSFTVLFVLIIALTIVLSLPQFVIIKDKILSMINVFIPLPNTGGTSIYTDYSTIHRFDMIKIAIDMFLRKPLFGYGVNGFQYFSGYTDGIAWSHNHFAEMLSGTGAIGFFFYNAPFFYCLYSSIKKKNNLSTIFLIFFFISMISIALPGQKLFTYFIGIVYAFASDVDNVFTLSLFPKLYEKFNCAKNCISLEIRI